MPNSPDIPRHISLYDTIRELRAPHTQTDTGWIYVGKFVAIGSSQNDPLTDEMSPAFLNGWKNRPGTRMVFRKTEEGKTEIAGDIYGGEDDTVVCVLPEDYRPAGTVRQLVLTSQYDLTVMEIETNGEVKVLKSNLIQFWIGELT